MKLRRLLPLLALGIAAASYAQDAVNLTHKPKAGETSVYKMDATMSMSAGSGTFKATMTRKVTKVSDNGDFTVEEKTDGKGEFGGQEFPVNETQTETRSAKMTLLSIEGEDMDDNKKQVTIRMDAIQEFHPSAEPVKVGDTWTVKTDASSSNGNIGAQVDYKVEAAEDVSGHKTFKVHATAKQTGEGKTTGDITYWIDRADGRTVKMDADLKQVDIPGVPVPLDLKYTITLQE